MPPNDNPNTDSTQNTSNPAPALPPPITPSTPYTFPQIIEADHSTITTLAQRIRSPTTPIQCLPTLLHEITWRLIRHDLSEDLVMRPTFSTYLGPQGTEMATHDHSDHTHARQVLLDLIATKPDFNNEADKARALNALTTLFDDLSQHMAVESGQYIPTLARAIDTETSQRLACEYASTLFMTPFITTITLPNPDEQSSSSPSPTQNPIPTPVFPDGIQEYILTPPSSLKTIYHTLLNPTSTTNNTDINQQQQQRTILKSEIEKELTTLSIGQWPPYSAKAPKLSQEFIGNESSKL